jgi:hypothetical protein
LVNYRFIFQDLQPSASSSCFWYCKVKQVAIVVPQVSYLISQMMFELRSIIAKKFSSRNSSKHG